MRRQPVFGAMFDKRQTWSLAHHQGQYQGHKSGGQPIEHFLVSRGKQAESFENILPGKGRPHHEYSNTAS